jgi:hypothetical protein
MAYYHLRYNIYPAPGFPVEIEEWPELSEQNEQQIKRLLEHRHDCKVTIIHCSTVCQEEYDKKTLPMHATLQRGVDLGFENIRKWKLAQPTNTLKELNRVSDGLDERYKYIDRPAPLL